MRPHDQIVRLWIATGICLLNLVLLTGVSAETVPPAGKALVSQNQGQKGIDISELTETDSLGFISPEKVSPWGRLFSDETERILLARGDTVYVAFEKRYDVKPGDLFTVFHSSSELDHPLTGRDMGYVVSFLGRIVLKREAMPHLFKAEIVECYRPIQVGNPVIPFQPVSPCIRLSSPDRENSPDPKEFKIPVVAAKDLSQVIGQFSVVYMNHGHTHGVHRGNLFQIVTRGGSDQPEEPGLPDQVLGYLLVVEARPTTSTGFVITAKKEFSSGVMLKAIDLKRSLKKVLTHHGIQHQDADLENDPLQVLERLTEKTGSRTNLPEELIFLSTLSKCPIK